VVTERASSGEARDAMEAGGVLGVSRGHNRHGILRWDASLEVSALEDPAEVHRGRNARLTLNVASAVRCSRY